MGKIGRNDPCPCGSGKKFKRCHMGKEEALLPGSAEDISLGEMGARIAGLSLVDYGRAEEIRQALDIKELTGRAVGLKFVDLKAYAKLSLFGGGQPGTARGKSGGLFVNAYKTAKADPNNLYVAISRDIDDSTLIHEVAHVLDYLGGSRLMPGTLGPLALELGIPVDHLEHAEPFGDWLARLQERFSVQLDADDAIIDLLYREGMLIKSDDIQGRNSLALKSKSDLILKFLGENSDRIDQLIRNLPGYLGPRKVRE